MASEQMVSCADRARKFSGGWFDGYACSRHLHQSQIIIQARKQTWWAFRIFFSLGEGEGASEALGGGGGVVFFIENPRRVAVSRRGRGRGASVANWGIGGGGLNIFFRGRTVHQGEHKPKFLSPDIFRWGGGLPREQVGGQKLGMSLETREIKLSWAEKLCSIIGPDERQQSGLGEMLGMSHVVDCGNYMLLVENEHGYPCAITTSCSSVQ